MKKECKYCKHYDFIKGMILSGIYFDNKCEPCSECFRFLKKRDKFESAKLTDVNWKKGKK